MLITATDRVANRYSKFQPSEGRSKVDTKNKVAVGRVRHLTPFAFANAKYERARTHYDDHEQCVNTQRTRHINDSFENLNTTHGCSRLHLEVADNIRGVYRENNFIADYAPRNYAFIKDYTLVNQGSYCAPRYFSFRCYYSDYY